MKRRFTFPGALSSMAVILLSGLAAPNALAQWTTSGTNIYNSNTGNVGIGTTTPGARLDVNGPVRFRAGLSIAEGITFDGNKAIVSSPASHNLTIGANAGTLTLRGNSVNILSGEFGNVNISGGNASGGTVGADVNINAGLGATPCNILLSTNGAGNVGIGTTNPLVKLQVNGGNAGQVVPSNPCTIFFLPLSLRDPNEHHCQCSPLGRETPHKPGPVLRLVSYVPGWKVP